ncbi:Microcystin-dependent protein [Aquimarina amphilecti]|uniref:Microcystin-dependent protein n=1 Tax=Aquimarina amphilecti TaxID=1038014 RepID=A0A1H7NHC0_AQUAM|nr:tail fiber protein [Aquimarina amphilecti]SEL22883.1 Microcystin-dependent protein [Aquimarina amphilecti]
MEGYISEIRLWGPNWAPRSWALCHGQLLPVSQNNALFSLIGTIYGGDGRTTFALPDLRGRIPIGPGNGPGLSPYSEGQTGGSEINTLNVTQLPIHTHNVIINNAGEIAIPVNTASGDEDESNPGAGVLANTGADNYASSPTTNASYAGANIPVSGSQIDIGNTGGSQPIGNIQPFLGLNYIICLQGIYPSRS